MAMPAMLLQGNICTTHLKHRLLSIDAKFHKHASICAYAQFSIDDGCFYRRNLAEAKQNHAKLIKTGIRNHGMVTLNQILSRYADSGCVEECRWAFRDMLVRDSVTWSIMVAAYSRRGDFRTALEFFRKMLRRGIQPNPFTVASVVGLCAKERVIELGIQIHADAIRRNFQCNLFVGTTLVDLYGKSGFLRDARQAFDEIPEKNVATWTALLAGYAQNGEIEDAFSIFRTMPTRNKVSWSVMISGFLRKGLIRKGTALFWEMPEKDVVAWTMMITEFSKMTGLESYALEFYVLMKTMGVKHNHRTVSAVLSACAKLQALQFSRLAHREILCSGFSSNLFICNALVDNYVNCGRIMDAEKVARGVERLDPGACTRRNTAYLQYGLVSEASDITDGVANSNFY